VGTATTDLKTAATTAPVDATCGARTVDASAWVSSKNGGNKLRNWRRLSQQAADILRSTL